MRSRRAALVPARSVPRGFGIASLRRAGLALAVLAAAVDAHAPCAARAAFELLDASPAALGSVSMDREPRGFFDDEARRGIGLLASHASLYGVEGLTSEQVAGSFSAPWARIDLAHAQVGAPGTREHATRLTIREGGARAVALSAHAERLALALEGEPRVAAWTLGAGVRGRASPGSVAFEVAIAADRALRAGEAARLALAPSVPWSLRLRAGAASLTLADRWEGDGRTSPRLVLDVRAGAALALRFGRGERPGRTGAALALRLGRLEVAAGRQDDEHGGSVSSASVRLLPGAPAGRAKP